MPDNLPESLLEVKSAMQAFIAGTILPLHEQTDFSAEDDVRQARATIREQSRAAGFYGKTQPEEFGGNPASTLELTLLREMLAATNSDLTSSVFGPGPGILHQVQGDLRSDYLEPVLRGEKQGAFGFTEPDSAIHPTYGILDNDRLTISGQKSYVTGGATADFVSILVNIKDKVNNKLGTAMVVIDLDAPGVEIDRAFQSLDGSGHVSLVFDGVQVPASRVIGKIGEGMPRALGTIGNVRLMVSAQAMGMCQWVLYFVEEHLKAPHRTGHPLGEREGVRLRFADLRIAVYVARSALYRTARLVDAGGNVINETIATKVFCTETAGTVVDWGVQLVGGQALVHGHPLEKLYRQVRALRLVEGASDLLRLNLAKGRLELGKGTL